MDGAQTLTAQPGADVRIPWAPISGVIATVAVFAIAQGLSYPLLSFILERQGTPALLIGLSAAMTPCGLIASAPLIPVLARRFGGRKIALCCAGFAALLLFLIGWTQDVVAWFPLRFLIGVAVGPLFVLSEVWLLGLAPPERRGRVVGVYSAVISAWFGAGPLALTIVGSHGWPPFLVGIGAFLTCFLWIAVSLRGLPRFDRDEVAASVRQFLPHAPVLLLAVAIVAAFEQDILSLLPVYGLAHGVPETEMSALLAVLVAGNIALQIPIGLIAELYRPRTILVGCATATVVGCSILPLAIGTALQWPFVFLWGAVSYGIYTVAFLELGNRFTGSMLIAGNAAFVLTWGIGGIAGPPLTGAAMDLAGAGALPSILGVACLALAAIAIPRRTRGTTAVLKN